MGKWIGLLDKNGKQICEGDRLRHYTEEPYQEVHGKWTDNKVICRNGMWLAEYLISDKGQQLPVGYSAGQIIDYIDEDRRHDKMAYFSSDWFGNIESLEVING